MNKNEKDISIDCIACKSEGTMKPAKIPLFNFILRLIGILFVILSILSICITVGQFFCSKDMLLDLVSNTQDKLGFMIITLIGAAMDYGLGLFIGLNLTVISGLIGWLLLLKRKVYKCSHCGYYINRA